MRRVVHYYPGAMGHSGVTSALWSWACAQARSGFEVCVLHASRSEGGCETAFVSKDSCAGLSATAIPHRGRRRLTLRPIDLHRYLGRNDLLVLHEGWVTNNIVAAAAARRAGVPYVVMPHGVYEPAWTKYLKPPRRLRNQLERWVLEGAAGVHVFFESEIGDVRALAPRATFITIPTGFAVPGEQWSGSGDYLAWVGRIDPVHKGLDLLVGAVAQLPPADRPVLRIRGYDYKSGLAALQQLITEYKIAKWVRLEGAVAGDEKMRFLQQARAYIHPSRWECHSIALLENLALGVPCLVSDAIHIADTLRKSRAALLSRPTEGALASALQRLHFESDDVAPRGRMLVADAFNWNALMPQFHAAMGRMGLQ